MPAPISVIREALAPGKNADLGVIAACVRELTEYVDMLGRVVAGKVGNGASKGAAPASVGAAVPAYDPNTVNPHSPEAQAAAEAAMNAASAALDAELEASGQTIEQAAASMPFPSAPGTVPDADPSPPPAPPSRPVAPKKPRPSAQAEK